MTSNHHFFKGRIVKLPGCMFVTTWQKNGWCRQFCHGNLDSSQGFSMAVLELSFRTSLPWTWKIQSYVKCCDVHGYKLDCFGAEDVTPKLCVPRHGELGEIDKNPPPKTNSKRIIFQPLIFQGELFLLVSGEVCTTHILFSWPSFEKNHLHL